MSVSIADRDAPLAPAGLNKLTALDLVQKIRNREVSPVQIVDAHLEAIHRLNGHLNAIVTLAADQARAAAKAAEAAVMQRCPLGPLHGLPVVIKDVTQTAEIRTTFGSPLYRDFIPHEDAEVVARLRRAGAIILGKTNTPEFACGANTTNEVFGPTRNPWNPELSPAGSSGGSAVAVATGMAPLAQGTDFGCSIRIPASFCGIVGLRTTGGLVPNRGMRLPWDSGQVHGPLARTAEDAALMLDAMTGFDPLWPISVAPTWTNALAEVQSTENIQGVRIAYVADLAGIGIEDEVDLVCRTAARSLRSAGAAVDEIGFDVSEGREAYHTLRGEWMVGQQLERIEVLDQFGQNLRGNVCDGLKLGVRDIANAEHIREAVLEKFRTLFKKYDFLLTPAAPVLPFPVNINFPNRIGDKKLHSYVDWIAPAYLITLIGLPAGSVPAGTASNGLPVGIQIVAPRLNEPRILGLAKLIQRAHPIGWPPFA